jgi:hypothetical protein
MKLVYLDILVLHSQIRFPMMKLQELRHDVFYVLAVVNVDLILMNRRLIARGGSAAVEIYYTYDDFLVISRPYAEIVEIFQNVWAS